MKPQKKLKSGKQTTCPKPEIPEEEFPL